MTHPIRHLIDVVHASDGFKQQQLAAIWPELAEAVAGVIEGMTEQDAPTCWWPDPAPAARAAPPDEQWHSYAVGEYTRESGLRMYDEPVMDPNPIRPMSPEEFIRGIGRVGDTP